jgi:adenosylmethionine-8-amino-7-oxononanoate aminotransferase
METSLWYPWAVPGVRPSLQFVRGQGSYIYDAEGRSYLNAASGLWNITLGLGNEAIAARMESQLRTMAYGPLFYASHSSAEALAKRLVALSDYQMQHVYLSVSGSAAVEIALRVARLHQRVKGAVAKRRIVSFDRSYHGCSWMTLSASGLERGDMERWDEILPDFQKIPSPLPGCEEESLAALAEMLTREGHTIACVIMEPILCSAGVIIPPPCYHRAVNDLCRKHGVVLVADEVATAGGRCGEFFASRLLGLRPDIIALSKGINSGYLPLGATLFTAEVVAPIRDAEVRLLYGSTQDGNPIACVATLASLDYIKEHHLCERALVLGDRLKTRLETLRDIGIVGEVRCQGLLIGIELVRSYPDQRPFTVEEAFWVRQCCQNDGLIVYHFESGLSLFPPMTMSDEEADDLVDILRNTLAKLVFN